MPVASHGAVSGSFLHCSTQSSCPTIQNQARHWTVMRRDRNGIWQSSAGGRFGCRSVRSTLFG
eukprot:10645784-Alexandrium_andersonii.AAC.1